MSTWVPEELDLESDQVREVYAKYGAAMYFAQVLEHGLANFVIFSRAGKTLRSEADADALFQELLSSTMGRQLREVLVEEDLPEELIARLRNALRIRNFLAHDYFREGSERFLSFSGRNEMLVELEALRAELAATDDELEGITRGIMVAKGITRETIEAELASLRARAEEIRELRTQRRPHTS
jgi:hypothetical protein